MWKTYYEKWREDKRLRRNFLGNYLFGHGIDREWKKKLWKSFKEFDELEVQLLCRFSRINSEHNDQICVPRKYKNKDKYLYK